uniref:Ig-like domain-containing protein n=1 Tax=Falco tinnunculus TaxID=100819 RepID=A0A8C4UJU5_FALTI
MEVTWVLLAAALLPLLPPGRAAAPLPTLAPPLSMVLAGQRRQLVVCVVSDLAPGSGHTVWISGGNGSALHSFAYGVSQEDGGTVCTVSLLPDDLLDEGDLSCHVGPNRTAPDHSSSPIHITGMAPCPSIHWCPPRMGAPGLVGSRCGPPSTAPQAGTGRGLRLAPRRRAPRGESHWCGRAARGAPNSSGGGGGAPQVLEGEGPCVVQGGRE